MVGAVTEVSSALAKHRNAWLVAAALGVFALGVSGCTSHTSGPHSAPAATEARPSPESSPESLAQTDRVPAGQQGWQTQLEPSRVFPPPGPRSGRFVSQWATTVGEARLEKNAQGRMILTLTDFSTGEGGTLRLNFNEGALAQDATGYYKVDDGPLTPNHLEFGPLTATSGNQSYDVTDVGAWLRRTQSITIYDQDTNTAWGSVAIGPV